MKKTSILAGLLILLFAANLMAQGPLFTTVDVGNIHFYTTDYDHFTDDGDDYYVFHVFDNADTNAAVLKKYLRA